MDAQNSTQNGTPVKLSRLAGPILTQENKFESTAAHEYSYSQSLFTYVHTLYLVRSTISYQVQKVRFHTCSSGIHQVHM